MSGAACIGLALSVLVLLGLGLYLAPVPATVFLALVGLGLPALSVAWARPEFGLLALIFLTSSFIPTDIIDIRLPIGGLDLRDLTLFGMLGLLVFQGLLRYNLEIPWWPVAAPLLVFLTLGVFSAIYAVLQHVAPNWAMSELRSLFFYTVYFVTAWSITNRDQLITVLVGLFVIADLTAGLLLLQQALGTSNRLLAAMWGSGAGWHVWKQTSAVAGLTVTRVIPPGHVLIFFTMIIACCLALYLRGDVRLRALAIGHVIFLNIGLLVTYTRAQWLATAVAFGLIGAVHFAEHRHQLFRLFIMSCCAIALIYAFVGSGLQLNVNLPPTVQAIAARAFSIFTPEETSAGFSMSWRKFEVEEALRSISEKPLWGVGLGNSYRSITTLQGEASGLRTGGLAADQITRMTRYLHSSYLALAVKMGVPGLLVFLWFCTALFASGWSLYQSLPQNWTKPTVLAILAGFLGLLQWSVLHSHLLEVQSTSSVGLLVGLAAGIHNTSAKESPTRRDGEPLTANRGLGGSP